MGAQSPDRADMERLGRAFGQLREGLFEVDQDFRMTYINDYGARLAGYADARTLIEAGARSVDFYVDMADHDLLIKMLESRETVDGYVCRFRNIQGERLWIELTCNVLRDASGARVGYWGILHDLTLRLEAEQARDRLHEELLDALARLEVSERQLRARNEALQAGNQSLREFSAAVTHDLRTPLVGLKGFAEMLAEMYADALGDHGMHLVERIHANAVQMDLIIQGLKELVLLGQDSQPCSQVDPARVWRTVLENRREQVEQLGADLRVLPGLPAVRVHPTKLYLLLDNLVSNALKFTDGAAQPRVRFGFGAPGDDGAFYIEDNGIGLDPTLSSRVFELFYRGDRGVPGAGIGLAIARRVVQLYGGRIWAEPGDRRGTRFCFRLPIG
ncbi:MAG: PAS domain-containing sensor histidine kinase [Deltaproteobacteria bacterium]|nr:PAS domain-containing sensor histidine kinase [Deltaproteobacteria bacterium]